MTEDKKDTKADIIKLTKQLSSVDLNDSQRQQVALIVYGMVLSNNQSSTA